MKREYVYSSFFFYQGYIPGYSNHSAHAGYLFLLYVL